MASADLAPELRAGDLEPIPKKIALAFPGQGRQEAGIGMDVIGNPNYPQANILFKRGNEILNNILKRNENAILDRFPSGEIDLADICLNNPDEILNRESEITQPTLTLVYLTRYQAYKESSPQAPEPDVITAHSLGKIAALYVAGSLTLEQAIELSYLRGKYTKAAANEKPGTMGYLNDTPEVVEGICQRVNEEMGSPCVWISSENSPRQQVVSGKIEAVNEVVRIAKEEMRMRNAGVLPIPYASHSPLMKRAREAFGTLVQIMDIKVPEKDMVLNERHIKPEDGQLALATILSVLTDELTEKVSWPATDAMLRQLGVTSLYEIGAIDKGTLTTSSRVINEGSYPDNPMALDWFIGKKTQTA